MASHLTSLSLSVLNPGSPDTSHGEGSGWPVNEQVFYRAGDRSKSQAVANPKEKTGQVGGGGEIEEVENHSTAVAKSRKTQVARSREEAVSRITPIVSHDNQISLHNSRPSRWSSESWRQVSPNSLPFVWASSCPECAEFWDSLPP